MGTILICPKCGKSGYLIKERPRKKHETDTKRGWYIARKIPYPTEESHYSWSPHKDYESGKRKPSEYFRIKHNEKVTERYRTNKQLWYGSHWKSRFCYIGAPNAFISKLRVRIKILQNKIKNSEREDLTNNLDLLEEKANKIVEIMKKKQIKDLEKSDIDFIFNLKKLVMNSDADLIDNLTKKQLIQT